MKKHIANIITSSRALLSLLLLFIPLPSVWFYIIYLFCGLSDMIDGTIARKTASVSRLGARLDTASDLVFMLVCFVKLLPKIYMPLWLWVWVIAVALIKAFNIAFVFIRRKKLLCIHSVLNKITGLALFLLPLTLIFTEIACVGSTVCMLASAAAMQEAYFVVNGAREI